MTLFDDANSDYSNSTATLTEQPTTDSQNESTTREEEQKSAPVEDFASALESFTTETEELEGEDHVLKGTVVKLTPTHAVVDIGAKSEGMLPIAEVNDPDGKPKFQPGDEIYVVRDKGETEEGYINLSYQKAQKLRA